MAERVLGEKGSDRRRRFVVALLVAIAAFALAALAVSGGAVATTGSCANTATLAGSAFEIDTNANLVVNTSGCIDWLAGGIGNHFRSGVVAKNDKPTGTRDDAFGQGTAEDDANPTIVDGLDPAEQERPEGVSASTRSRPRTAKFLELFWSRVQNPSGTTNMDFELNQKFCDPSANPTNCANNGTDVTPGDAAAHDRRQAVTYDLAKGGTVPTISIRTWGGSAWGAATVISGTELPRHRVGEHRRARPGDTGGTRRRSGACGPRQQDPFTSVRPRSTSRRSSRLAARAAPSVGVYLKSRSSDSFIGRAQGLRRPGGGQISNCTG